MSDRVRALSREARKLPPAERAALIDDLLASLDELDARIDALWAAESEDRLEAIQRGEMGVEDLDNVLAELERQ